MVEFNDKKSAEANEKAMNKAIGRVTSGQLTYAVRDTEIDGIEIHGQYLLLGIEHLYFDCGDPFFRFHDQEFYSRNIS